MFPAISRRVAPGLDPNTWTQMLVSATNHSRKTPQGPEFLGTSQIVNPLPARRLGCKLDKSIHLVQSANGSNLLANAKSVCPAAV